MNKKAKFKILGIVFFLILISFSIFLSVGAIQITTMNNSLSAENLTFTGDENITRYLEIHKYANVTSAYMNLSGHGAWDISTASHLQLFSIAGQELTSTGIFFKPDGSKMYIIGTTGDDVNEYNLGTNWDVTSASYLRLFSVAGQDGQPSEVFFKTDGSKMYVLGVEGADVNEYNLGTNWDVTSASYLQRFDITAITGEDSPRGMFFKSDGSKMYILGGDYDNVDEFNLGTNWDVTSASYVQRFSIEDQDTQPGQVFFSPDGTKMYISGIENVKVYEYTLGTAWDVTSASYVQSLSIASEEGYPTGLFFKPTGSKMYIVGTVGDEVNEYDLSIYLENPYLEIGTPDIHIEGEYIDSFDTSGHGDNNYGITTDGVNIYTVDADDTEVYIYTMSGVYVTSWDTSVQSAAPGGIATNGTNIWILDMADKEVYMYTMGGVYISSFDTSAHGSSNAGITTDGNYIWVLDGAFLGNQEVYKYEMNGTYISFWDSSAQSADSYGITTDGNYLWVVSLVSKEVNKYTMTGVFISSFGTTGHGGWNAAIATDGIYFWIADYSDDIVYKYYQSTTDWNYVGSFSSTEKTLDFSTSLNTALNSGACDCTGCSLDGNNCIIPFLFHSDTAGTLEYSAIDINYNPIPSINLVSPENNTWSSSTKTFNCSATDEIQLSNITFYFWNSTGDLNLSITKNLTGTSNFTTYDMTFYKTNTYSWNCKVINNNSYSNWGDNYTLNVNIANPVITLNKPTDEQYINTLNVQFNYTPEHSTQTVDTCELYGNWTGVWHLNQTNSTITEEVINSFNQTLSEEINYLWNVKCNTSETGNSAFATSNFTFIIDITNPNVEITTANRTTITSLAIVINYNITDTNIDECYFTLRDSAGAVHNYEENDTLNCSTTLRSISTLDWGTYTIQMWGEDKVNNINSSMITFTTQRPPTPPAGGGGITYIVGDNLTRWSISTTTGAEKLEIYKIAGTIREFDLLFENLGETDRIISLKCENIEGNLCDFVTFENQTFQLIVAKQVVFRNSFLIDFPEKVSPQLEMFNILARDDLGREVFLTVECRKAGKLVELGLKLISSKLIFGIKFPYAFLFIIVWICTSVLANYTFLKEVKRGGGYSTMIGLLVSGLAIMFI